MRFLKNVLVTSMLMAVTHVASAKDQSCYTIEHGEAPWDIRSIHGVVVEKQLDGSYSAFDAVGTSGNVYKTINTSYMEFPETWTGATEKSAQQAKKRRA